MARKKDIKPLMVVKHDFVDALDNFVQKAIMLDQVCRTLVDEKVCPHIPESVRGLLKERVADFEKAFMENPSNV